MFINLSRVFKVMAAATLAGFGLCDVAVAEVTLPRIFGDHMVLQQDAKLPIWGRAEPGERITVEFAGQTATATASQDGAWRVELQPLPPLDRGTTLTIRGNNILQFEDVVVGEVWLASGQSNMEFGLQIAHGAKEAIEKADDPSIRLYLVPYASSLKPLSDIASSPDAAMEGRWQVCTPKVMAARWGSNGFSAVAYFFARELRASTGRPVGVIGAYKGGTAAQAWVSIPGLGQEPTLAEFVKRHEQWVAGYPEAARIYPPRQAEYLQAIESWNRDVRPPFVAAMNVWNQAARQATAAGHEPPPKPSPSRPRPQPPIPPDGGYFGPGNLFNGMIAPLVPYAMRGVIWYQGESNTTTLAQALQYEKLFGRLIHDWRTQWGIGDFPFLYVQLASYRPAPRAGLGNWVWLRESQANALAIPNTAMVTAIDVGDPNDPHPADKSTVGHRLSLAARKLAYGEAVSANGPVYAGMKVEGSTIRLSFKHEGGLTIGIPPWSPAGTPASKADQLTGFTIAAGDQHFVKADAVIEGDSVVVSSPAVAHPVAVRYNWSDVANGNLYDRQGMPAAPFRTDRWRPSSPDGG